MERIRDVVLLQIFGNWLLDMTSLFSVS